MSEKTTTARDRVTLRLSSEDHATLNYWAEVENISVNELVMNMLDLYKSVRGGDFRSTNIIESRINQLIEQQSELVSEVHAMSSTLSIQLQSLTDLTRGDNYLYSDLEREGE